MLSSVAPEKNSTFDIVAGATGVAVAVSTVLDPKTMVLEAAGAVRATVGPVTLTLLVGEVDVAPFESVTRAVRATIPVVVGVHEVEYGEVKAVPTTVVPAKKSTRATVALPAAVAVAVNVAVVPSATDAPLEGDVRVAESVPTAADTFTLTGAEVTIVPFESVTRAVKTTVPALAGVQLTLYGAVVSAAPIATPSAKNCTLAMVVPTPAVAFAETVTGVPTVPVELLLGAEIETVGATARTVTVRDVARELPLSSIATATKVTDFASEGVHVTEYGAVRSVATNSPSA